MTAPQTTRQTEYPIEPLFLQRWSPRAFGAEAMPQEVLLTILEAARWAPSSYNAQPWRFLYAHRDTPDWERFLALLIPFNRSWAERASVLLILVSRALTPGKDGASVPAPTHSLDAGAAWALLALQAARSGWAAHGMVGFDKEATRTVLGVPADFSVEMAIALGRPGDPATLPEPLRAREVPSGRIPLSEIAFAGNFPAAPAAG